MGRNVPDSSALHTASSDVSDGGGAGKWGKGNARGVDGLDGSLGNWLVDFGEWRYVSRWKSGRVEALYAVETKLTVYDLTQSPHILPPFRKLNACVARMRRLLREEGGGVGIGGGYLSITAWIGMEER